MNRPSIYGWIVLFFLALFIPRAFSQAQPVRVEAKLDTNAMLIGDQIHLNFRIQQPAKAMVNVPVPGAHIPQGLEVLKSTEKDTVTMGQGKLEIRQRFLITSFDTGRVEIPRFKFTYSYEGRTDSLNTLPMDLMVQAVQVDTTQSIFDIKGPFGAPITFREALPYILAILGLALLVLAIIYVIRKRKKNEPLIKPRKPAEPAHVYALRELERLKEDRLWQQDHIKFYYTRLTGILRTYLWMRYKIKTLERTTDEILESLKQVDLAEDELYRKLEDTLRLADLVKFAKMVPSPSENEESLDVAYEFVNKTMYVPEQPGESSVEEEKGSSMNEKAGGNET